MTEAAPTETSIQSVETALTIIEGLQEMDGAGVTELAEELDIPKSTVHRHLSTLERNEYLVREGDSFRLSYRFLDLGGYVRTWKVDGEPTEQELELYEQCYDQLYRAIGELQPGNTTKDVAEQFREYDDDKYGSVSIQQAAHSIGISLYEGIWMSRAYSLDYPAEIEEGMYFAIETFAGHEGLDQTVRLEENVMVTDEGPVITTMCEHPDDFTDHFDHRDYEFLENMPGHGPA